MSLKEKDKRVYIGELQSLQRQINFLQEANKTNLEPSIEKTMDILRNSQDMLYGALSSHGVTAEEVYRVIMENTDKELIREILNLQKNKTDIEKQLANPAISPQKRQFLEMALADKDQEYKEKWDEAINSPNKADLMPKLEQAIIKNALKNRDQDREREPDRSR